MQREHIQGAGGHFLLLINLANISQTSVIVIHHAWTHSVMVCVVHKYSLVV
jgi:hypothetical protein